MKNELLSWALAVVFLGTLFSIFYLVTTYLYLYPYFISVLIIAGFLYVIKTLIKRDFFND